MKKVKIISLGLIILSLTIVSCSSYNSQESFASSFANSSESSVSSNLISSELSSSAVSSDESFSSSSESSTSLNSISSESSNSSIEQSQYELKPISDELASYYKSNFDFKDFEPDPGIHIAGLYRLYKEDKEQLMRQLEYKCVYDMSLETSYHCYYLHQSAYNEFLTKHLPGCSFNFWLNYAYSGLVSFFAGINEHVFTEETVNQTIMEFVVDSNKESVPTKIDDYCLLDIVRYFRFNNTEIYGEFNPDYEPRIVIDFMTFERTGELATINKKDTKNRYRFFNCFYANPKTYFNYNSKYKFDFFARLIWFFGKEEITIEDGIDVVKTKLGYYKDRELSYYDDLEACIISKTFLESGNEYDSYEVTYIFDKINKLFSA